MITLRHGAEKKEGVKLKIAGKRGVSMVIDLSFAVLIFLLVSWSLTGLWTGKASSLELQVYEDESILFAERALDTLVSSKGQPSDWETRPYSELKVIGLAETDRVLDEEKLRKFAEFDANESNLNQKLLIGANSYYFRLIDPVNGNAVKNSYGEYIRIGQNPSGQWLQSTVKRPVTFFYQREGETIAEEHGAIAELTLYLPYRTW